jgi:hypothetical protein
VIDSLISLQEPRKNNFLHTATPWHNCIIEVQGDRTLYLAKSRVAEEAVDGKRYKRAEVRGDTLAGGRYLLLSKSASTELERESDGIAHL